MLLGAGTGILGAFTTVGAVFSFPGRSHAALNLATLPRFRLLVGDIRVVPAYPETGRRPNVEHQAPRSPQRLLEDWAKSNVRALGGPGFAYVTVREASIRSRVLGRRRGRFVDFFRRRAVERLDGVLRVELEIRSDRGKRRIRSEAQATARRYVMSDHKAITRHRILGDLSESLVRTALRELDRQVRAHMAEYLR